MTKIEKELIVGVITNKSIDPKTKLKMISSFLKTVSVSEDIDDPIVRELNDEEATSNV